MNNIKMGEL